VEERIIKRKEEHTERQREIWRKVKERRTKRDITKHEEKFIN
jgi:hypothetical protein